MTKYNLIIYIWREPMKHRKHIANDETGVSQILESLIAIGISISLLLIFFISANNIYGTHDRPSVDMKDKSIGIMESLLNSPGQGNAYESSWENNPQNISSLGLGTSPTVAYGSFHINEQGEITDVYKKPFYDSSVGIAKTCFLAGTKIVMADRSYKNIEDIVVGDAVKSFDVETGEIADGKVTAVLHHAPGEMGDYYLVINSFLRVTPNHQIYSNEKWIYASDLKIGDPLFYPSHDYKVNSIEKIFEKVPTYDFEVGINHCYFVAMDITDVLVHNAPPIPDISLTVSAGETYSGINGISVTFTGIYGESPAHNPYSYEWDFGDGTKESGTGPSLSPPAITFVTITSNHIYNEPGLYTLTLSVTNSDTPPSTNQDSATVTIEYNPAPVAKFTWFDCDGLNPNGTAIFFDASSSTDDGEITSYKWDFNGDGIYDRTGRAFTQPDFGNDHLMVSLKVTDNNGSYDTYECTVQANTLNLPDIEQAPWILTGKNIYPYYNSHQTLAPCDENYYVQYINLSNGNYSFEIKEKTNLYTIIDYEKITNLPEVNYWTVKSILGLNELDNVLYNFNISVSSYAGGTTFEYGPDYEDASAIVTNDRDVLIYHKSAINNPSDPQDITPPYYENGKITLRIFIGGPPSNKPPNMPSTPNPADGATNVLCDTVLSWTGGDPDGDPVTYDVYFEADDPTPDVLKSDDQTSTSWTPGMMLPLKTYYWKIVAWDNYGASTIGYIWRFTTKFVSPNPNRPPNEPSNPYPDRVINVPIDADLNWTGGDPDGDPVTYDVYFGTTTPPTTKVSANQSGTTYDPPGNMMLGTWYHWKIIAWDNQGATREGPIWDFQTELTANSPPCKPYDPYPGDGDDDIPIDADLSWTCTDLDGDPLTYDVYFGTTNPPPKIPPGNQSGKTYDPGRMNPGTVYYWKIIAWDSHHASNASLNWSFTAGFGSNNPPNVPSNPSPPTGATNVDINAVLSWNGGDPDEPDDTVKYDVYFGTTMTVLTKRSANQSGTTYDPPGQMLSSTTYQWKIVAWDNHGASTAGPIWTFTTRSS
jgi:hypothetical protein